MTGETERQQCSQGWGPIIKNGGGSGKVAAEGKMKCVTGAWNQRGDGRRTDWTAISWCLSHIVLLGFGSVQARTSTRFPGSNLM